MACGILVPQLRIKPVPLGLETQSLNCWTIREVPVPYFFKLDFFFFAHLCSSSGNIGNLDNSFVVVVQ